MLRLCGPTCDNLSVGLSNMADKTRPLTRATAIMHNLPVCIASHHLAITYTDYDNGVQCTSIFVP